MEDTYQDTLGKMSTGHNRAELPTGIHLYLFGEKVENLTLPIYPEGRYQFEGKEDLLYIEGSEEKWRAYAKNDASFYVKNNEYKKIALQDKAMTILKQGDSFFFLYCEYINKESRIYHNYFTGKKDRICIGKDPDNDLIYYNPLISDFSFALERRGKAWEVVDCKDSLFLYVNGKRKEQKRLYPGDKLSFLGLHIIIGYQFFSVTDGNNRIHTCKESLKPVIFPYDLMCGQDSSDEHVSQKLIHRSPRRRLPMKPEEIRFEAPPMSLNHDQIPLMLRMGGSMVSSARGMLMGNMTSMVSSVLFPILNSKYTEKQKKEYEERRVENIRNIFRIKRRKFEKKN